MKDELKNIELGITIKELRILTKITKFHCSGQSK
jgi:hypothetical protein